MKTRRLSTKVAIITLAGVAVIIAIIYLAYLSHKGFEETMVSQAQKQLLTVAKATARGLEDFIQHLRRDLAVGSNNPEIQTIAQKNILENEAHEKEYHPFKAIFVGFDVRIDSFYLLETVTKKTENLSKTKSRLNRCVVPISRYVAPFGAEH